MAHRPKSVHCAVATRRSTPSDQAHRKVLQQRLPTGRLLQEPPHPTQCRRPATPVDVGAVAGRRDRSSRRAAATAQSGGRTMTRIAHVTAIALVLLPTAALAQQQRETFKDANGRTL